MRPMTRRENAGLIAGACGLGFGMILAMAGCSSTQLQVACSIDGTVQPIAATALAIVLPQATPAVDVDTGLIHPAVVAYCKSLNATAVAVPVAVAAPVSGAPAASK